MTTTFIKADPDWAVLHPVIRDGKVETVHLNEIVGWVLDASHTVVSVVCVDGQYLPSCAIASPNEYVQEGDETFQCIDDYLTARQREVH